MVRCGWYLHLRGERNEMRRGAIFLMILAAGLVALGPHKSSADTSSGGVVFNGACFNGPYNTFGCPPTPVPVRVPILPNKNLSVSGPVAEPAGTSRYTINIASQLVGF